MTTNMHELGHLMGFGHSNEDNAIREGKSGALGRSVGQVGGPNYCLNGHKFALSGWMNKRKKVVSPSMTDRGDYVGRLVAFVDMEVVELLNNGMTLLEIGTGTGTPNAFLVYNRQKSFNDGTREKGDQVTVVQQSATRDIDSKMLGGLDAGQSITIPGTSIVVECAPLIRRLPLNLPRSVDSSPSLTSGTTEPSLFWDTGALFWETGAQTTIQIGSPTQTPIRAPFEFPFTAPSEAQPTALVEAATETLSRSPSRTPSILPSEEPVLSEGPSLSPSIHPSRRPKQSQSSSLTRSIAPSIQPTPSPSIVPSDSPTRSPSRIPMGSLWDGIWQSFGGDRCYFLKNVGELCQHSIQCCSGWCTGNGFYRTCKENDEKK